VFSFQCSVFSKTLKTAVVVCDFSFFILRFQFFISSLRPEMKNEKRRMKNEEWKS